VELLLYRGNGKILLVPSQTETSCDSRDRRKMLEVERESAHGLDRTSANRETRFTS
jgi:hypothetical protein